MATIKDAIQEIVDELKNLRDLRNVPDAPPEGNDRFPFVVVYPASGEFQKMSYGFMTNLHNINIELHVERKDLPRDFKKVVDIYDQIPKQLELGLEESRFSAVSTWETISYIGTDPMEYAGVDTLGVIFTMENVKILDTVST